MTNNDNLVFGRRTWVEVILYRHCNEFEMKKIKKNWCDHFHVTPPSGHGLLDKLVAGVYVGSAGVPQKPVKSRSIGTVLGAFSFGYHPRGAGFTGTGWRGLMISMRSLLRGPQRPTFTQGRRVVRMWVSCSSPIRSPILFSRRTLRSKGTSLVNFKRWTCSSLSPRFDRIVNSKTLDRSPLDISEEVEDALHHKLPIIALESAIITHGLPYPTSLKLSNQLEELARNLGVTPAHIAILNGRIKVGLTKSELAILADPEDQSSTQRWKVGRRELVGAISQVSAFLLCRSSAMLDAI